MKKRAIKPYLQEVMLDTPILAIIGARQVGKSTLAQKLIPEGREHRITLDDQTILSLAMEDPIGLIRSLKVPALIDEIQKAPHLTATLKMIVDENRLPGRFVITGSADLRTLSKNKTHKQVQGDSMAGRVEWIKLHPLTQAEIAGADSHFIDELINGEFADQIIDISIEEIIEKIVTGGYPEVIDRLSNRRNSWFKSYINSTIRGDLQQVHNLRDADSALKLLTSLAINVSGTLVKSNLYKNLNLSRNTADSYINSLIASHLVELLPAWHRNEGKILISSPKINFVDTGLVCYLRQLTPAKLLANRTIFGDIFESFVVTEIAKLANLHQVEFEKYHYREKNGATEIDLILHADSVSVGIEIKAGATYSSQWKKHLNTAIASNIVDQGIIIYTGNRLIKLDEKLWLVPVAKLIAFKS